MKLYQTPKKNDGQSMKLYLKSKNSKKTLPKKSMNFKNKRILQKQYSKQKLPGLPKPTTDFLPQFELNGSLYNTAVIPLIPDTVPPYPFIFQPTYVLSIRPERMQSFIQRMGPWGSFSKRASCVVGSTLDRKKLLQTGVINLKGNNLKLGQIGCSLSHLNAWQNIVNAPYEYGTVFEDDAGFSYSSEVEQHVKKAMLELKMTNTDWDILFWCINPIPHVAAGLQTCHLQNWHRVPLNNCMATIAYTIKKSVAQFFVQNAKPIHNPVDVWISEYFGRFKTFCIKPVLGFIVPSCSDTEDQQNPGYLRFIQ
jgi:GR25 family glycosyltransferase involved in LPS biosynthesis